jgi:predicted nucleic acid-binding protein
MHLLDTDVVWALRNAFAQRSDEGLGAWVADAAPSTLYISAASLLELEAGTVRIARREKTLGAAVRTWIETQVLPAFEDRILPIDAAVAKRWAQLAYANPRDGILAATALEHGFTLITRERAAFKVGRVRTLDPWTYRPTPTDIRWDEGSLTGSIWLRSLFR